MAIKRKDFQKTSSTILEFLLKLPDEETSARLRDTLLHALHFLQQYYLVLQKRDKEQKPLQWTIERGLSPLTPFREAPDKFEWQWISVDSNKVKQTVPKHSLNNFQNLPAITLAVREGDLRYVKELLNENMDLISKVDSFGRDLLTYAVQFNQINILKYLLEKQANVNTLANDGSTCLHRACYGDGTHCNIDIVRLLLEYNADHAILDVHLRSPLHWSVLTENIDCLKLLIEYKANIHVKDVDGMTPAMWACHLDRFDHFQELSRHGDDAEERDNDGRTWIHYSVRKTEPLECLKSLLSPKTMLLRDTEGRTCLHVAAEQGSVLACRLIFDMGEKNSNKTYIHEVDNQKQTPLHIATKNGHARVLKELLDHGGDPQVRDVHGISSLDYALNRGLYFCRSVFEVYLRDKRGLMNNSPRDSRPSTTRSFGNEASHDMFSNVAPSPPINGHANFIRRPTRATTDSVSFSQTSSLSRPPLPNGKKSGDLAMTYPSVTSFSRDGQHQNHDDENDHPLIKQRRIPSARSTDSSIQPPPPVKPRKSSTPTSLNDGKHQQQQKPNYRKYKDDTVHSDDDADSLQGQGGNSDEFLSDYDDANDKRGRRKILVKKPHQNGRSDYIKKQQTNDELRFQNGNDDGFDSQDEYERPTSRLSVRISDEKPITSPTFNGVIRRNKQSNINNNNSNNRHSMYDDYRFLDEPVPQQQIRVLSPQPLKSSPSKQRKEFPTPVSNRIGSGGNQSNSGTSHLQHIASATNRLKSGSKSSSTESIPTLDLTVAGQKVFRTKNNNEQYLGNSLPSTNALRPPSGRLKPLNTQSNDKRTNSNYNFDDTPHTLDDVTNNTSPAKYVHSPTNSAHSSSTKTHLYKKKLTPLNGDIIKKYSNTNRLSNDRQHQQYVEAEDINSDTEDISGQQQKSSSISSETGSKRSTIHVYH
ncbi:unnamed protein product [Didymodactylos carnosus]|uniref:Inversin n=1 Tax=Didymodactylos carnosus TaxID=1234261 RepID=A0A813NJ14_9BILA|nr:unnamed protein product [Didymodactylos carnosus]CAF0877800.1 unnamed protein product [Didymodactylos carnosus]CAF3514305.1 unnamed protein product [Didymodactylos carnosus]CAF3661965.1 unnamed protein product [Didymodactylos carnosus]